MATYTIELRDVIENIFNESDDPNEWEQPYAEFTVNGVTYGKLPTVPDYTLIGLGTYPIFDADYRAILNGKIIDEYFTREIGTETIDNWTLMIRRKMDQIMPYYNKLYESELVDYGPLDTMRIESTRTEKRETHEETEASNDTLTSTTAKSRAVNSTTPQTMLAGNKDYASSAADSNSDSEAIGTGSNNASSDGDTEITGSSLTTGYQSASAGDLMVRYRASLLNIDTMILFEIQDCFMALLNNGDAYSSQGWYNVYNSSY